MTQERFDMAAEIMQKLSYNKEILSELNSALDEKSVPIDRLVFYYQININGIEICDKPLVEKLLKVAIQHLEDEIKTLEKQFIYL